MSIFQYFDAFGELISGQPGALTSGTTVGLVLYDEGFILLYNEEPINGDDEILDSYSATGSEGAGKGFRPNWTYFWSYNTGSSGSQGIEAADGVGHERDADLLVDVALRGGRRGADPARRQLLPREVGERVALRGRGAFITLTAPQEEADPPAEQGAGGAAVQPVCVEAAAGGAAAEGAQT